MKHLRKIVIALSIVLVSLMLSAFKINATDFTLTIKVGDKPLIKCAYLLPFLFLPTICSGFTNNLFWGYRQLVRDLPAIGLGFTNNWFGFLPAIGLDLILF